MDSVEVVSVHVTDVILLDKPDTRDEDDKSSASEALQLTVRSGLKSLTNERSKLVTGDDCTGEVVQVSVAGRLEAASCSLSLEVDCRSTCSVLVTELISNRGGTVTPMIACKAVSSIHCNGVKERTGLNGDVGICTDGPMLKDDMIL